MDERALREMLRAVRDGTVSPDDALAQLARLPFADLGHTKVDHHRPLRQGLPEAVYGPGKSPQQCAEIVTELLAHGSGPVLLTRAEPDQIAAALDANPNGVVRGRTVSWRHAPRKPGSVAILTAGTADAAVADECDATLEAHGVLARRISDVGVAGLHRLLASLDEMNKADVVVVAAGMEGALASVVGGLTAAPVIAVPTSTGYGTAFQGVTALLAMLSSCASGVTVVGIDNGFGAACAALRFLNGGPRHG
ncbi:MAG TPA: nickel pincer cofactor biosynthesis protein LarB [Acidimicrobiales bacterium]